VIAGKTWPPDAAIGKHIRYYSISSGHNPFVCTRKA